MLQSMLPLFRTGGDHVAVFLSRDMTSSLSLSLSLLPSPWRSCKHVMCICRRRLRQSSFSNQQSSVTFTQPLITNEYVSVTSDDSDSNPGNRANRGRSLCTHEDVRGRLASHQAMIPIGRLREEGNVRKSIRSEIQFAWTDAKPIDFLLGIHRGKVLFLSSPPYSLTRSSSFPPSRDLLPL